MDPAATRLQLGSYQGYEQSLELKIQAEKELQQERERKTYPHGKIRNPSTQQTRKLSAILAPAEALTQWQRAGTYAELRGHYRPP